MKKGLIFCLFAIALILTACDKDKKGGESFDGFTINQGAAMTMSEGASERLSLNVTSSSTVTPTFTYESSDPSKVDVDEDGVVYAYSATESPVTITVTGTAAVSNEKVTHTATIKVTVTEFAAGLEFHDLYWMQAAEDWQDVKHVIIRIRYHRGYDDQKMHDYDLDTLADMQIGDPANPKAVLPQDYEHWVFLKDTINSKGEKVKKGVFMDSVRTVRSWLLSTHCYFGESFECADQGAVLEYTDCYMFDKTYSYCLGDREFVDDVTALDTIRPAGVLPMPYPGVVQIGHFDADQYLAFFDAALINKEQVEYSDYAVWEKYDGMMKPVAAAYDEETGEAGVSMYFMMGYPTEGAFYMSSDDNTGWFAATWYDFKAMTYGNAFSSYCLKLTTSVDEETGEENTVFVYPLEMADSKVINYTGGSLEESPRRTMARRERVEMPVSTKALNVKNNVINTIGATFRMAVLNK